MKFGTFVLRRILLTVPVLFGVTLITFGIAWKATGGALYRGFLSDRMLPAARAQLIHQYGFDRPWYAQYFAYLSRLLHGDFGYSSFESQPVIESFKQRFPSTLELTIVAMIFTVIVGIFLGVLSAVRKDKPVDHITRLLALAGVSLPIFVLGLLLKLTFATDTVQVLLAQAGPIVRAVAWLAILFFLTSLAFVVLDIARVRRTRRWFWPAQGGAAALALLLALAFPGSLAAAFSHVPTFPLGGRFSNELIFGLGDHGSLTNGPTHLLLIDTALAGDWVAFKDVAWHLALPGLALGYTSMAIIARMMRSTMLETLQQDYVRTARAKGLPESEVLRRHARRNALIPVTTVVGLSFGGLLGGAVLTETIFQWPGLGQWSTIAISHADTNAVLSFTLFVTLVYVSTNFIVDIVYAMLDPRIRLGGT